MGLPRSRAVALAAMAAAALATAAVPAAAFVPAATLAPRRAKHVMDATFGQRIDSIKAAAVAGVAGGFAGAVPGGLLASYGSLAQWEFGTDTLSLECALFGIVYRYVLREDTENAMLKQGAIGAFAITRALAAVRVSDACASPPLMCGPPLGYLDWAMCGQIAGGLVTAGAAFAGAAAAVDYATEQEWIEKVPPIFGNE